jgi:hypothetical protein
MGLPMQGADEGQRAFSWLLFSEPTSQSAFFWSFSEQPRDAPACRGP